MNSWCCVCSSLYSKVFLMAVIMPCQPTQARVCEPGCVRVEVDVFYRDWHVGAGPPRDTDTHQRVLLLGRLHHLKHPHRVGQGEVKILQVWKRKGESHEFNLLLNVSGYLAVVVHLTEGSKQSRWDKCFVQGHLNLQPFSHRPVRNWGHHRVYSQNHNHFMV